MRTRGWLLLAALAGCASRSAADETDSDGGAADLGEIHLVVIETYYDAPTKVHVLDVSVPGGQGSASVVVEAPMGIVDPVRSPSNRRLAIGARQDPDDNSLLDELYVIDFDGAPLDPPAAVEHPEPGWFGWPQFVPDESALITRFESQSDGDIRIYYVPLLESGPATPIEVVMPDDRLPVGIFKGISPDGRWLAFFADDTPVVEHRPAGLYVSEIVDGQPTPAVLVYEATAPRELGGSVQARDDALFFETHESDDAKQIHRLDLATLEVQTLTQPESELGTWTVSDGGSRLLHSLQVSDVVETIELVEGEPQPIQTLSPGASGATSIQPARFLDPEGRYAAASLNGDGVGFIAWYDFEGPTPMAPVGFVPSSSEWHRFGKWLVAKDADENLMLIDPIEATVEVVTLPAPWVLLDFKLRILSSTLELRASEGPPNEGVWTLRLTDDQIGPLALFEHPIEPGQTLPLEFNPTHVPNSDRHFYEVLEADESRTIWENDGQGVRTPLLELDGNPVYHHLIFAREE